LIEPGLRILFLPVSGRFGTGEYARLLALAHGVAARWPSAAIRFVLSREAPYAGSVPYPATLLAASPTFHSAEVAELIAGWRPHLVVFDNSGRTAQLRAARRAGAAVVYISARRRQRRKAFRLRWMTLIDEHWIAYPKFVAGALTLLERLKLRVLGRPTLRYLDVVFDARPHASQESLLSRLGVASGDYVLIVPGGGTGHPGADEAVEIFHAAAVELARSGVATLFVGRMTGGAATVPNLTQTEALPQSDLAALMRGAHLIIANGGSTLIQAIACGKACIAVPIAKDQRQRALCCADAGVALAAPLDAGNILETAQRLLRDPCLLESLAGRAIALGLTDGVATALRAIDGLLAAGAG